MAECEPLAEVRELQAISTSANRFTGLERKDHLLCCQVLVKHAPRTGGKAEDHAVGGARRSNFEGHRNISTLDRMLRDVPRRLEQYRNRWNHLFRGFAFLNRDLERDGAFVCAGHALVAVGLLSPVAVC
jgi:hypothetical protein